MLDVTYELDRSDMKEVHVQPELAFLEDPIEWPEEAWLEQLADRDNERRILPLEEVN